MGRLSRPGCVRIARSCLIEPVELEVSGSPVQLIERVYIGWSRLVEVSGEVKTWWRETRLEAWMGLAAEGACD